MLPTSPTSSESRTAVEVVATFGDSVVGVRHVSDPQGGAVRPATRGLIYGGAGALAAGAIAFFAATRIAAANQADLAAWVARKKPAWSFRPDFVPGWLGVLAFIGLTLGLSLLIAGLARRKRELEPATVSIGTAAGVDFAVDGTAERQTLVGPNGAGFVLDLTGMTGEITGADGTPRPIAPLAAVVPITHGMRVRAQLGKVGFHIAGVDAPRRQTMPLVGMIDRRMLGYVAAAAAAHLAVWAISRSVPADPSTGQVDFMADEDLSMRLASVDHNEAPPPPPEDSDDGDVSGDQGLAAMRLESGTVGAENDHSIDPAKRKIMNRDDDHELARKKALAEAASAGVLGSTLLEEGDMFGSMVGTGSVSSGFDDADIIGAIDGDGQGAPNGWGQNASGNGHGGGGTSYRVGGYNTINNGTQVGERWGMSGGKGCTATSGICRKHKTELPVTIGPPRDVIGDYDAAIIRRYVKRKLPQISYCYEQALLANANLEGTVMATWTINASGLVMESVATGVSSKVSDCIATVISTIKFPAPPQIGVFKVRYPFVLHKHGT